LEGRQEIFESEMGTFGVVPNEPLYELLVKLGRMEQIVHMEINKFLLDGSVESLTMGIHLGRF